MTVTERAGLPSTLNDAQSTGSVVMWARPLMRSVVPEPGTRNNRPTRGSRMMFLQQIGAVVAAPVRHHQGFRIMMRTKPARSPRGEQSSPSGPLVASADEGRSLDEGGIFGNDVVEFLDQRRLAGNAIERLELLDRGDDATFFVSEPLPALLDDDATMELSRL